MIGLIPKPVLLETSLDTAILKSLILKGETGLVLHFIEITLPSFIVSRDKVLETGSPIRRPLKNSDGNCDASKVEIRHQSQLLGYLGGKE